MGGGEIAACVVSPTFVPPTRLLVLRRILCVALCRSGHGGRGFEGWSRNAAPGGHASDLDPINKRKVKYCIRAILWRKAHGISNVLNNQKDKQLDLITV